MTWILLGILYGILYVICGCLTYCLFRKSERKTFSKWTVEDRKMGLILACLGLHGLVAFGVSVWVEHNGDKPANW